MLSISFNEGTYQDDFAFWAQVVLRRREKYKFCTQLVLRRVKQRLATTVTFKGVIEEKISSRAEEGKQKITISALIQFL